MEYNIKTKGIWFRTNYSKLPSANHKHVNFFLNPSILLNCISLCLASRRRFTLIIVQCGMS